MKIIGYRTFAMDEPPMFEIIVKVGGRDDVTHEVLQMVKNMDSVSAYTVIGTEDNIHYKRVDCYCLPKKICEQCKINCGNGFHKFTNIDPTYGERWCIICDKKAEKGVDY